MNSQLAPNVSLDWLRSRTSWRFADGAAGAIVILALFLLLVGVPRSVVDVEGSVGEAEAVVETTMWGAYIPAVVPLVLGAATLGLLWTGRIRFAWIGVVGLAVYCGMFIFSAGLLFAPLVLALATATTVSHRSSVSSR